MTQERQTSARSTRVLILDEDRVEGGMLAFHLRREGLVVMLMTSAEEAADAIAWAEPDVLLVEVAAQGFDGREFLASLSHLPVDVFAVADRQLPAEVELDALRLGVIDIMMKPIDPVTLARRLKARPVRQRRGSVAGLPEGGISGDLGVHSVVHLLQMAHRHRLNARLHIEMEGDWAVLLVRHGEIIDAEAPSGTGREAAFQMIRAVNGAFVLFPLPLEAEELSRDDVIRADLATLVADAIGRKEPRGVNSARAREQETFVLPHIGSPRGPMAKREKGPGEDTLEYAAQAAMMGRAPSGDASARVRRPGERERVEAEAEVAREDAIPRLMRQQTVPIQPLAGVSLPPEITMTGMRAIADSPRSSESRPVVRNDAMRPVTDPGFSGSSLPSDVTVVGRSAVSDAMPPPLPSAARFPIESPTVDEGFDESTDQEERRRPRAGYLASQKRPSGGPGSGAGGAVVETTSGSGLRRIAGGSAAAALKIQSRRSDPAVESLDFDVGDERESRRDDMRRTRGDHGGERRKRMSWSLGTMVLAGATLVFAIFLVVRLASRDGDPAPVDVSADPTLRLGQALVDLDEGRRDAARTSLSTLAADKAASSEALAALARMHYQDGRLVEAQALIERLVERNPGDAEALAWLGLIQAERKDMQRANESFGKALRGARGELAERLKWLVPDARNGDPRGSQAFDRAGSPSPGQ